MLKRAIYDPSFWILVAVNIFCIGYYQQHSEGFSTIVCVYWIQSVLIGLFNFLDLLTVKHADPSSMLVNGKPMKNKLASKGCMSIFFLFHYQFFHLVYAIFLIAKIKGPIDFNFIRISFFALLLEMTIGFIRNKKLQQQITINYGQLFFIPYLRIIPMHLMILAPAFLGITDATIFLVLKLFADLGMYLLTMKMYTAAVKPPGTSNIAAKP